MNILNVLSCLTFYHNFFINITHLFSYCVIKNTLKLTCKFKSNPYSIDVVVQSFFYGLSFILYLIVKFNSKIHVE